MPKDDISTRIDQVFAEGDLVDEAVEVAAADAVEHHRRAETPLVILRDGETVDVPAEGLDVIPAAVEPLTSQDLVTARSASNLLAWFDECLRVINAAPNVKRAALLHEGRFKQFYEEMYPFALFVRHLYPGREDVVCRLNPQRAEDWDGVIESVDGTKVFVQITTTAFDRSELLRMRHFLQHGRVSAFGRVDRAGRVSDEAVAHDELLKRAFEGISSRLQRKSGFIYGPDHVLLVSFDDWLWFGTSSDVAALKAFIEDALPRWQLNIATLYILGLSGRTLLSFPVQAGGTRD
jgi:hypothetical protein